MDQQSLQEFFVDQIKDLYDVEQQLVKALPKIVKAASSADLAEALNSHLEETRNHVTRLEQVFALIGQDAKAETCKGMKGLLAEGDDAISKNDKGELRDLAIIAGCQRVEHYEISGYGTARAIAEQLGLDDAAEILGNTEDEENAADEKLTGVAEEIYATVEMDSDEELDETEDEEATFKAE